MSGLHSRRTFVRLIGIAVGAATVPMLAACGSSAPAGAPKPAETAKPVGPAKPATESKPAAQAPAPAPTQAPAQGKPAASAKPSSAQVALDEARKFKGETLTVTWSGGLQAQDPLLYSGPKFEELTGVKVKVVEQTDNFSKLMTEHLAGSNAFDAIADVVPKWVPDLVSAGVIIPLDDYIKKYMVQEDLNDYLPIYKTIATYNGKYYGLFDDGDTLLLYYRKDLVEDPQAQADFKAKFGRELGKPQSWDWQQLQDAAAFFTERGKGQYHGVGMIQAGFDWNWFQAWFRMNGGQFFEPESMKPGINSPAALKTVEQLLELRKQMPPGADQLDAVKLFTAYLTGQLAITSFWPPLARWADSPGTRVKQLTFVPETQIGGKTGYALLPGGFTEMAAGFFIGVWANSTKKDLAYFFAQWMTSPETSLDRVQLPYTLRDPFRISHIEDPGFRKVWGNAGEYLDQLKVAGSGKAFLDLILPGVAEYEQAYKEAASAILGGNDPKQSLDEVAQKWERTTERLGRDRQKDAYKAYLSLPGSTIQSLKS